MTAILDSLIRRLRFACLGALLVGLAAASMAQVPIIQPGAPGEPARQLSARRNRNCSAPWSARAGRAMSPSSATC
jgi:hypothetical protein